MLNNNPLLQINFNTTAQAYVIEASAGTGKTWTIERLFVKALLEAIINNDAPIAIENILVVTFTKDATNELKQRISCQLQATINQILYIQNGNMVETTSSDVFTQYLINRHQKFDYTKDINILMRAYQNFDMASIYTIHGFCNKILSEYQFECNVNSQFEVVVDKKNIITELVTNFMRSEIINNKKLATNLDIIFNNLLTMFEAKNKDLISVISNALPKDLFTIINKQYKAKYNINMPQSLDKLLDHELFAKSYNKKHASIAKAEFIHYLINYISTKYHAICARNNIISYDEIIQKIADSIECSTPLSDKIFTKYPIAFIDEFQDTDELQWQIFNNIYHISKNVRGHIVVVGDPKQAIYKFRGANVDIYVKARNIINNKLELNNNFRSHPNIMNFINNIFDINNQNSNIMNSYLGNGINYTTINAMAQINNILPTAKTLTQIAQQYNVPNKFYDEEVHLVSIRGKTKPIRTQQLLNSMTFEILMLLRANPDLIGKIAILVSKNKEAIQVAHHLNKYGIKATELKLGNIFATSNASELYNLLKSLTNITNQREFIKSISSNIFGIPLHKIHISDGDDNTQSLNILHKQFFIYKQIWDSKGVISLIYAILNDNTQKKFKLTNREMANIWQLAELVNKQSKILNNNTELLYWFKHKIDNANDNIETEINDNNEELIRLDNDEQQITISTQHKSKGLEYEILFCPYFKAPSKLNSSGYKIPFFSNYQHHNNTYSELITDEELANMIIENDNKEIHRLNYVALTRAKSRIYIYLKQNTYGKDGKYSHKDSPDKLIELFGYVKEKSDDVSHNLFNYKDFFTDDPYTAIKQPSLFNGVCVYNRGEILIADLQKIKLIAPPQANNINTFQHVNDHFICKPSYIRQSYSGLTRNKLANTIINYYNKNELSTSTIIQYQYSILHDKSLKGSIFGVIFHELCENYPLNNQLISTILYKYNIPHDDNNYIMQLTEMIDKAFSYHILDSTPLYKLHSCNGENLYSINEFKFNLTIQNKVSITNDITKLIATHFGIDHPYTKACQTLHTIEAGFLVGFIDLFFEYQGKYWVLDYKTNTLADYTSSSTYNIEPNSLIESMAEHHYYLQYLLYLVAVKRYLESKLQIDNATHLLGGAVYYYVRGIYNNTESHNSNTAIILDDKCQELINSIDILFKKA